MESNQEKEKLPMYYQQIYELMVKLNDSYVKRHGQIYFRIFKQFYARVRFELSKEQRSFFEYRFKKLEKGETVEKNEFKGLTADFRRRKIAEKSDALLNPVYELQLKLYECLENSKLFNYLKQNINKMELM